MWAECGRPAKALRFYVGPMWATCDFSLHAAHMGPTWNHKAFAGGPHEAQMESQGFCSWQAAHMEPTWNRKAFASWDQALNPGLKLM